MDIFEKDVISLSDGISYIVAKKINYNNVNYYCVVDIENGENIKFLFENGDKLFELEDEILFETVFSEMSKDVDLSELLKTLKDRIVSNSENN